MNVDHRGQWVSMALAVLVLSGAGVTDSTALAAVKKKETRQPTGPPTAAPSPSRASKDARIQSKIQPQGSREKDSALESIQKQAGGRGHRRLKGAGKHRPQATVQAKPNLSYHGILERPQRYDPDRDHRKGGSSNPRVGDVLHDHFQELDKNHDGAIDPIERIIGRTDLDRDL